MPTITTEDLAKHYSTRYERFGDSPDAHQDYPDAQLNRIEVIANLISRKLTPNDSILDFGCGTGILARVLNDSNTLFRNNSIRYTGVDITEPFLERARVKFPLFEFCKFDDIGADTMYDFFVASGVFNINTGNNEDYWQKIINWAWDHTNKAIAFNFISTYVDFQNPELYYLSPEDAIAYIKNVFGISTKFSLHNDYLIRNSVSVPYEYTIFIYK